MDNTKKYLQAVLLTAPMLMALAFTPSISTVMSVQQYSSNQCDGFLPPSRARIRHYSSPRQRCCYQPTLLHHYKSSDDSYKNSTTPSTWQSSLKDLVSQIDSKPSTDDEQPQSRMDLVPQIDAKSSQEDQEHRRPKYQLGLGKNRPLKSSNASMSTADVDVQSKLPDSSPSENKDESDVASAPFQYWNAPQPVAKPITPQHLNKTSRQRYDMGMGKHAPLGETTNSRGNTVTKQHLLTTGDEESARLTKAVWDKGHFDKDGASSLENGSVGVQKSSLPIASPDPIANSAEDVHIGDDSQSTGVTNYQQIDLSIPPSVYSLRCNNETASSQPVDLVWDLMRHEAQIEAQREPLLVSFLYSTILNHPTLEAALAFHLANRLESSAMLSTQVMELVREALDGDEEFQRNLR